MKSQDSISYETEKTIPQKKFTKSYYNSGLTDDYFKKIIGMNLYSYYMQNNVINFVHFNTHISI